MQISTNASTTLAMQMHSVQTLLDRLLVLAGLVMLETVSFAKM